MWDKLGFSESPYNTNPLTVCESDTHLLVGRHEEALELFTLLESSHQGIAILSGSPGVGKTSFLNVQQYLLETEAALFGPKLLAARKLCPTQPNDDPRTLALRALDSLYRSVELHCSFSKSKMPPETKKIGKWLNNTGSSGINLGLDIMGFGGSFGREIELPSVSDVTFEGIADAIKCVTSEVVNKLKFHGLIIALDNMENLEEKALKDVLISFRDTLFSIEKVWWILIGQSGLGSFIQSLDPRVFERITGSGLEITPISLDELDTAVNLRVQRFRSNPNGKAPLSKNVHEVLFNASLGETRYVFKYSNNICTKFIHDLRSSALDRLNKSRAPGMKDLLNQALDRSIGDLLVDSQISDDQALGILKNIVKTEFDGLSLKAKEKEVLKRIGLKGKVRPKEFKDFSIRTQQDFSGNYLFKMYSQNLLNREQEGRAVTYRLRGIAKSAFDFDLL